MYDKSENYAERTHGTNIHGFTPEQQAKRQLLIFMVPERQKGKGKTLCSSHDKCLATPHYKNEWLSPPHNPWGRNKILNTLLKKNKRTGIHQ